MAKLLITGDTGLLGSTLACEARRLHQVFGVSRRAEASHHRSIDLTDARATLRCLDEIHPDLIVHCAAATDVERCEMQPAYAYAVNVEATERLAQWAARNRAHFTFISTDSVFDGMAGGYCEEDKPRPLNEYARTKLAGEHAVMECCGNSLIVRTNFYGWNRNGKPNLGKWMLGRLLRGKPPAAFTDVRFSPLFVNDLAKFVLDLIASAASGMFHVAARDSCSKYDFALLLGRAFDLNTSQVTPILLQDFPFRAQRPRNTTLARGRCTRFLGREMPSVEDGIARFQRTLVADSSTWLEAVTMQS